MIEGPRRPPIISARDKRSAWHRRRVGHAAGILTSTSLRPISTRRDSEHSPRLLRELPQSASGDSRRRVRAITGPESRLFEKGRITARDRPTASSSSFTGTRSSTTGVRRIPLTRPWQPGLFDVQPISSCAMAIRFLAATLGLRLFRPPPSAGAALLDLTLGPSLARICLIRSSIFFFSSS